MNRKKEASDTKKQQRHGENKYSTNLDEILSKNAISIAMGIEKNLLNHINYNTTTQNQRRSISRIIEELKILISIIQKNPRFDFQIIQNKMDALFKKDRSLTGYIITFDFKDPKSHPHNRGTINFLHERN